MRVLGVFIAITLFVVFIIRPQSTQTETPAPPDPATAIQHRNPEEVLKEKGYDRSPPSGYPAMWTKGRIAFNIVGPSGKKELYILFDNDTPGVDCSIQIPTQPDYTKTAEELLAKTREELRHMLCENY